ncbi:hypothetical protein [Dechloromonas sp. ZS-1]|uniref:hypothetical protein n=1 Tax=Dechloromonas sp. ZS-1 TaxID=3138067 RepID=UPI0031FBDF72
MNKGANVTARSKKPEAVANEKKQPAAELVAKFTLMPQSNAAAVIEMYGKPFGEQGVVELCSGLKASIKKVQGGDMGECEAMLVAQANALQSIFMNFSRRALNQEYQKNLESFFRMAMKAQNQCRMTLETLAAIKNPPVVFAKQANIANGPQQVNNGIHAPAHAEKTINQSNELLEVQHGERLDTGTAGEAASLDPGITTVGEIDRAANRRGKGQQRSQ